MSLCIIFEGQHRLCLYISLSSSNKGCTLHLDTDVRLESIEDYDVILKQLI